MHSNAAFSIDSWLVLAKLNRTYVKGGHVNAQLMHMNAHECTQMHSEAHVDAHRSTWENELRDWLGHMHEDARECCIDARECTQMYMNAHECA